MRARLEGESVVRSRLHRDVLASGFVLCLVVLPGCDAPVVEDPGVPDADVGFEVDAPEPPILTPCPEGWVESADAETGLLTCDPWPGGQPTRMTPCPEGWREVEDGASGLITCSPWPEGGRQSCAPDEAHFPGSPGCVQLGTPCPASGWAADLPDDRRMLFVQVGAAAGGSGSREAPFGTVSEALDAAADGTVVALSRGTFDEAVEIPGGVTLWGACVAGTVVTCSEPNGAQGVVMVSSAGEAEVRNLSLGGERPGVVVNGTSRAIVLQDVVIAGTPSRGCAVLQGATLTARNLVVRDTRVSTFPSGGVGHGILVTNGGHLEVSGAVIERAVEAALFVTGAGSTAALTDVALDDTRIGPSGLLGRGVEVQLQAQVDLTRAVIERSRHDGLYVVGMGSFLRLTDAVVSETINDADGPPGAGLFVGTDAQAEVSRAVLERNQPFAMVAFGSSAIAVLTDVVVRDSLPMSGNWYGRGINVQEGGRVEVSRGVIAGNREVAVAVHDGTARLEDVVIRDTLEDGPRNGYGRAINLEGGVVEMSRALLERNRDAAIYASGATSSLRLLDVVIRDTLPRPDETYGNGLAVALGAVGEATRVLVDRNRDRAVLVTHEGTVLVLSDVVVRDTRGNQGTGGRGINVQDGARVEASRIALERNREVTLFAGGPATSVTLTDVVVRGTMERECAGDWCAGAGGGLGVSSIGAAQVTMTRFLVTENVLCGLQLAVGAYVDDEGQPQVYEQGGAIDLHDGEVSHNQLCGINVQTDGFDLRRLQDRVIFTDNTRNLDMNELPVPGFGLDDER